MSTEYVDYVEEPMKYQALRPHFFLQVGGGVGVVVWDVGWGGVMGVVVWVVGWEGGVGGCWGAWGAGEGCCGWQREGGWWHG